MTQSEVRAELAAATTELAAAGLASARVEAELLLAHVLGLDRGRLPGRQSVNTTDSAVRITHLPTGTVVSMQNEKSQLQNKEAALRVLRARLLAMAQEEAQSLAADARRTQVRTVDRSERVRTYNFPENRIADHRVNYKAYNLDQVLDGDLDGVIDALAAADTAAALATA